MEGEGDRGAELDCAGPGKGMGVGWSAASYLR